MKGLEGLRGGAGEVVDGDYGGGRGEVGQRTVVGEGGVGCSA